MKVINGKPKRRKRSIILRIALGFCCVHRCIDCQPTNSDWPKKTGAVHGQSAVERAKSEE